MDPNRNDRGIEKKKASEIPVAFSGLETQNEINRLLDKLYDGGLDRASRAKREDVNAMLRDDALSIFREARAEVQADPNQRPR